MRIISYLQLSRNGVFVKIICPVDEKFSKPRCIFPRLYSPTNILVFLVKNTVEKTFITSYHLVQSIPTRTHIHTLPRTLERYHLVPANKPDHISSRLRKKSKKL